MVQTIYSKMHPVSWTNTHHGVTDVVNKVWLKIQKSKYLENGICFTKKLKIKINLCLRSHILRSYSFVAEVTLNISRNLIKGIFRTLSNNWNGAFRAIVSVFQKFILIKLHLKALNTCLLIKLIITEIRAVIVTLVSMKIKNKMSVNKKYIQFHNTN